MRLADFDYALPKELIAQYPLEERDTCKLMVLDRLAKTIEHVLFSGIVGYLKPGDCLILNDTKVIPARLFGKRKTGGKVELFLLEKREPVTEALVRPSGRLKGGERIVLESGDEVELLGRGEVGRLVRFSRSLDAIMREAGHTPLPPYIGRADETGDASSYQTVYAACEGATASPTAGLHVTRALLDRMAARGVRVAYVTLHTNYGTFAPVKEDDVTSHRMHKEYFVLPAATAAAVRETKRAGGRVFAVGTTSARVLEHCADILDDQHPDGSGEAAGYTSLFIYPGYQFRIVDALITNFHLPKSTLLILVSALAGREFILDAYRRAVEARYRFFSYGDAMLIV